MTDFDSHQTPVVNFNNTVFVPISQNLIKLTVLSIGCYIEDENNRPCNISMNELKIIQRKIAKCVFIISLQNPETKTLHFIVFIIINQNHKQYHYLHFLNWANKEYDEFMRDKNIDRQNLSKFYLIPKSLMQIIVDADDKYPSTITNDFFFADLNNVSKNKAVFGISSQYFDQVNKE